MTLVTVLLLLSVLLNTAFQLSLKRGIIAVNDVKAQGLGHPNSFIYILTNPFILTSAALLLPSTLLWLKAISLTDLSIAYPFQSLTIVLISLGSIIFLKERITAWQWSGIAMILSGIIIISRS